MIEDIVIPKYYSLFMGNSNLTSFLFVLLNLTTLLILLKKLPSILIPRLSHWFTAN